jgi:hypothetical protein
MLQLLEKHKVKYLIVGAYALAVHGYPRSTGDIDIWVKPETNNAKRVFRALAEFGAPLADVNEETFSYPGMVYQIGVAPCRIDIISEISGDINFDQAFSSCLNSELEGVRFPVLSKEMLIKNKESTGRGKDIEDAKWLKKNSNA